MSGPFGGPVCVTGASGYVAGPLVRELLRRGATVRATVRDPGNERSVGHLTAMAAQEGGRLELHAADLTRPGSFDGAVAGCEVVFHTASPFVMQVKDPQRDLVDPAVGGTRTVLSAVGKAASVRRVVLTSSCLAVFGDPADTAARPVTEDDWNTTGSLTHQPYGYSKTVAEREAWAIAGAQSRWSLVTINPGFVMGPSETPRVDSTSVDFLQGLIDGRRASGIWNFSSSWVDVRDLAVAHVEAALRPEVSGRHLTSAGTHDLWEVIGWLREDFGDRVRLPGMRVPRWLAHLIGPPMGFSWRYVAANVDVPLRLDASKAPRALGVTFRPVRDTIRDHVEQLLATPSS
jgi:nucleoside-diphosphate-sugar epimerase